VSVGPGPFGGGSRYLFPDSALLAPGEHTLIYCDQNPEAGAGHAAFGLNRGGDRLSLAATSAGGARSFIDEVVFGPQLPDRALARLGCSGLWRAITPTPGRPNVPGTWLGMVEEPSGSFVLAFPTTTNASYVVEYTDALGPGPIQWTSLPSLSGDGIEKVVPQPLGTQRYYRVRKEP
jgi:hypothetical protein